MSDRLEVTRVIPATPAAIFAVLCDPSGHVAIDASGTLMSATGAPVGAVGDTFEMHMHRDGLGDIPLGPYDVTVSITAYEQDAEIAWTVLSPAIDPPFGHVYGYRLRPSDAGTEVTAYYDWSGIDPLYRDFSALAEKFGIPEMATLSWPVVPESALRATLGILRRVVVHRS
ncbi:MAG: SRPBCC family protein [Sporichthyaceae bacterium]